MYSVADQNDDHMEEKRRKMEQKYNGNRCDQFSNLPDDVLISILSFMPTLNSVHTSILSKRWRFLWRKSPNLELKHDMSNDDIDCVLNGYGKTTKVKNLTIFNVIQEVNDSLIEKVINFAVKRGVEELYLSLFQEDEDVLYLNFFYKLPDITFNWKTLVHLKLRTCQFSPPSSIHLPILKSLVLIESTFCEKDILNFTSSCPQIQKLKTISCNCFTDLVITLRNSSLVVLEISDFLRTDCCVVIDAPFVKSFGIFSNRLRVEYVFFNMKLVTKASLNFDSAVHFKDADHIKTIVGIINVLGHVEHLQLCSTCMKILWKNQIACNTSPSIRSKKLDIDSELLMFDLYHVFKIASGLETLKITLYANVNELMYCHKVADWLALEEYCSSHLQDLKTVQIRGLKLSGEDVVTNQETKLIEILLAHLQNLETLNLWFYRETSLSKKSELFSFRRASKKAQIMFLPSIWP